MARQRTIKKQIRRPRYVEAAKALDCTLSHLRRVVIGERESRSLLKRYRAWRKGQRELRAAITASVGDQVALVNDFRAMRSTQSTTPLKP